MSEKIKKELKQLREENKYVYHQLEKKGELLNTLELQITELNERNAKLNQQNRDACRKIEELRDVIKDSVTKDFTLQAIAAASGNLNKFDSKS